MAIPIIRKRELKELVTFELMFDNVEAPGCGWSFECDEAGNVEVALLTPAALENLALCQSGDGGKIISKGVSRYVNRWIEPAQGRCHCGLPIDLEDPLDNECRCGLVFNMSGQQVTHSRHCDARGNPYEEN